MGRRKAINALLSGQMIRRYCSSSAKHSNNQISRGPGGSQGQ